MRVSVARIAALASVAVVIGITGGTLYVVNLNDDSFAECRKGVIASGEAAIGGPFELVNANGEKVTNQDVITTPSLLYFGFTNCPGICPVDNARNAEAVVLLENIGIEVTPVFISVDPLRDTPEVVGRYAGYFHPRMIGLTGSPDQVAAAAKQYRIHYSQRPARDDGFYMVDHSTQTYLILPGTGYVDFYARSETPQEVADQVTCYARAAGYA